MARRDTTKNKARLLKGGKAFMSEYERMVENKDLKRDLDALRTKYKMSIKNNSAKIDSVYDEAFSKDVQEIIKKYRISKRMEQDFWSIVWGFPGITATLKDKRWAGERWAGMPHIQHVKSTSYIGYAIIITPETDIDNKIVFDFIKKWQRDMILISDTPTKPKDKEGWILLWEWEARHPSVTRKEIAGILEINYVNLDRKLKNLDKEMR